MLSLFVELYKYRQLLMRLIGRDLRVRYKRSALGLLWAFAEPLFMMALFSLVFSFFLRINTPNYPVFVLCGIVVWSFFQTGVVYSLTAISGNSGLIKKIYFPREILPLATVFGRFVHFFLSLLLLTPFLIWFNVPFTLALLYLPILALIELVLVCGAALMLTGFCTLYEDVAFLVNFAFMGLFYVSPVFYPVEMIPLNLRPWYMLNPVASLISAYRSVLLEGHIPALADLAPAIIFALILLVIGTKVFRHMQWQFAEVL
ncbi:MAG: ABC transporter permease [Deltaproteobacteria bacterium]|nr:ABC transporter permease [Deltaproteobacteria bacterium]